MRIAAVCLNFFAVGTCFMSVLAGLLTEVSVLTVVNAALLVANLALGAGIARSLEERR